MPFSHYRTGNKGKGPADFFIATSSGSGRPHSNYVMSIVDSTEYLTRNGITFDYWLHCEDCHVDDARNFLVSEFMKSGAKSMVFIDDDVGWDAESLARLLLCKDVDIVGGAYPLRQDREDYPVRIKPPKDSPALIAREDGLLEVEGIPTGFMRIERHVIEALYAKRKHMQYLPKEVQEGGDKITVVFERMMVDGKRWSGDLNFCREARLLGFKVHVMPEMTMTHQGGRRWEGNLGTYLRRINKILDPRLDAAMEKLILGDNSMENFNDIWRYYNQPYAACAAMMKDVYDSCLEAKGPILEVGSGLTTVIAGIACQRTGQMVHSLEHDLEWFQLVRNYIQTWKVKGCALYYAPLIEYPEHAVDGRPMMWYGDLDGLPEKFDVAIIDGPPRRYGREGIYKVALDRIKDASLWLVDDTDDKSQLALVSAYAAQCDKKIFDVGPKEANTRHYARAT